MACVNLKDPKIKLYTFSTFTINHILNYELKMIQGKKLISAHTPAKISSDTAQKIYLKLRITIGPERIIATKNYTLYFSVLESDEMRSQRRLLLRQFTFSIHQLSFILTLQFTGVLEF
jgi:hypothetical protein